MEPFIYYISGPMTGLPEFNYPMFEAVASELRGMGYDIVSPHETDEIQGNEPGSQTWEWYMRHALRGLLTCNAIVMLPGWTRSKGARRELDIALDTGMALLKWEKNTLVEFDDYEGVYDA